MPGTTSCGFFSRALRVARARPRARHTGCPAAGRRGCCDPAEESRATNSPSATSAATRPVPDPWARASQPFDRRHSPSFRAARIVVSHPKHTSLIPIPRCPAHPGAGAVLWGLGRRWSDRSVWRIGTCRSGQFFVSDGVPPGSRARSRTCCNFATLPLCPHLP